MQFKDNEFQVQHLKGKLKLISATTAPVNLGQTDWSDDESDDELKIENTDPENVEVTDANKGLVKKFKYHRVLLPVTFTYIAKSIRVTDVRDGLCW